MQVLADDVTIKLDTDAWKDFLGPFTKLAGALMTASLVIAVVMCVVWACIAMFERLASMRGGSAHKLIGILALVSLVSGLASGVGWMANKTGDITVSVDESSDFELPSPSSAPSKGT